MTTSIKLDGLANSAFLHLLILLLLLVCTSMLGWDPKRRAQEGSLEAGSYGFAWFEGKHHGKDKITQ